MYRFVQNSEGKQMYIDYCVDKVKLYIHGIKIADIQTFMHKLSLDMQVKSYESKKITACRYNYSLNEDDTVVFGKRIKGSSFYLGIEPNWSRDKNKTHRDIIIEYNPNKIILNDFKVLEDILPINEYKTEIMSLDIAIDIYNYSLSDLIVYKRHGNEYKCTLEHNKVETIYLGAFGENGHIKIYDKAKEQKVDDFIWTRYEITYKKLGFMDIRDTEVIENTKLADVVIKDIIDTTKFTKTDSYILLTSLENQDLLNLLDRRMKKKIIEYQKNNLKHLDINLDKIIEVYKNFKVV